ncbi:MAG: hypothetical protein GX556_00820, partial [Fibrobacter sp.]|nr:hypothetical protein [Fibrobacter sp.]
MKKIVIICIFCIAYAYSQTTDQISESLDGITIPSQIISDWETVDRTAAIGYKAVITSIASGLPETNARIINSELQNISNRAPSDPAWKNLYVKACHFRRISRMKPYTDRLKRIVFTSHYTMGALFQGFQEGIGGNKCSNYKAGASLCLLTMDNYYSQFKKIHESTAGVIKDPDVSYDGNKILFAETKDN